MLRRAVVVLSAAILPLAAFGQATPAPAPVPQQQTQQLLSPQQLDDLVAPVALYPDPLLGQVLAASTYPLEVVEANQWRQQNSSLQGQQLIDAAKQQNWDPSVQALVAFPDAMSLLTRDVRWTTDLGDAFLAQQADVMAAIQRMRARAQSNGHLSTTPQQTVTTGSQDGQTIIQIQPASPQVVYVPVYNPAYVYGPAVWGAYPSLWYPSYGFGFGPGCYVSSFFPGWAGWGGWGWGLGWYGNGLFVNAGFFNHYGFRGYGYSGFRGRRDWAHNPEHRLGVGYRNRALASRFNTRFSNGVRSGGWRSFNRSNTSGFRSNGFRGGASSFRSGSGASNFRSGSGARSFGGRSFNEQRGVQPGVQRGLNSSGFSRAPQMQRSFQSQAGQSRIPQSRTTRSNNFNMRNSAPAMRFSSPRGLQQPSAPRAPAQRFSAPRSSGFSRGGGFSRGASGFSAPRSSGSRGGGFSRGGGGGHSGGVGGRSAGGHSGRR